MSAEPTDRLNALSAAREIQKQNPTATPLQLAAMAWLEGRIALCNQLRPALYDNSYTCQRCGRKVHAASTAPVDMSASYVCFHCSAGDEPRAA